MKYSTQLDHFQSHLSKIRTALFGNNVYSIARATCLSAVVITQLPSSFDQSWNQRKSHFQVLKDFTENRWLLLDQFNIRYSYWINLEPFLSETETQ